MGNAALHLVTGYDRQPPWDLEAEFAVLGGCLCDGDAVLKAVAILQPEHFYREQHRLVFAAIQRLHAAGQTVDPVTLQADLGDRPTKALPGGPDRTELDAVGGLPFIGELLDIPTGANIEYHAGIVRDRAQRRQLIAAATEIIRSAHEPEGATAAQLVEQAEQRIYACSSTSVAGSLSLRRVMDETYIQIEKLQQSPGGIVGLGTGFPDLDLNTGGLERGDLVVVAARPSMGKTAFATSLALAAALDGHGVLIDSLEMSRHQIVQRLLCHEARVNIMDLRRGTLQEYEYARLAQVSGYLHSLPLWINETAVTVAQLRAEARRTQAEHPELGMVVVDYIGHMDGEGERQDLRIGSITKGLKRLAKELNVVVVALSQLSRAPLQRKDPRPHLGDLRDSGNIEQDADLVAFVHRPEYYASSVDEAREKQLVGKAEIIIGKQRNGPTGTVYMHFEKSCARFESYGNGSAS